MTILGEHARRCKWSDDHRSYIQSHVHGIDLNPKICAQKDSPWLSVARAPLPGGYGVCEPPDPIPNSAVKPDSADGTIAQAMEE
jgi:hypothetical protein